MYKERFYRKNISSKFKLEVSYRESDLLILTDKKVSYEIAQEILSGYYSQIEEYAKKNPDFKNSLSPVAFDEFAPLIVKRMIESSQITKTGPFASVAGAIAFYVGKALLDFCEEVVVENGGDIFLKINTPKLLGVYLGEGFNPKHLTLKLKEKEYAFGVASSSSVIGHSLNFGKSDLLTVVCQDAILADGFATALSNKIKSSQDAEVLIQEIKKLNLVEGILIAIDNKIYLWGNLEIDG